MFISYENKTNALAIKQRKQTKQRFYKAPRVYLSTQATSICATMISRLQPLSAENTCVLRAA